MEHFWRPQMRADCMYVNPLTATYYADPSAHMALGEEARPTTSNCVPSRFTSIPETIPPICSALGPRVTSVPERTLHSSPHPFSDSGISVASRSPEFVDTSSFQRPSFENNMGQMPYYANPNCSQFYPQNPSFIPYDPNVVSYSAALQNEVLAQRPRSPPKRQPPYKIKKCRRPKRKSTRSPCENIQRHLANDRERTRTKKLNDAFALLRKMIPCRPSDKLSKIQTLRLAVLYIDFLLMCLQQDNYLDPRSFTISSVRDKLSKDFSYWRLKREGKRFAKLIS
ncbi:Twist-related protein 2 like protein [Argiope bruennichi]|uniref:Twist-related protein 2 like protein n=1 Tax=Argiope bruennichi TaxID=94029 RepID=A0A8T0FIQ8_ARGBR|nr:Twist-related protein 2 like protein [Argiope bruennichi]